LLLVDREPVTEAFPERGRDPGSEVLDKWIPDFGSDPPQRVALVRRRCGQATTPFGQK
jgi:hypothetical protein